MDDEDIKKLIQEYADEIESKEPELRSFKEKIDGVISGAEAEFSALTTDLETKFQANTITEEEYLKLYREKKAIILANTKSTIDSLVASLETN